MIYRAVDCRLIRAQSGRQRNSKKGFLLIYFRVLGLCNDPERARGPEILGNPTHQLPQVATCCDQPTQDILSFQAFSLTRRAETLQHPQAATLAARRIARACCRFFGPQGLSLSELAVSQPVSKTATKNGNVEVDVALACALFGYDITLNPI